jgi:hypothetical protein
MRTFSKCAPPASQLPNLPYLQRHRARWALQAAPQLKAASGTAPPTCCTHLLCQPAADARSLRAALPADDPRRPGGRSRGPGAPALRPHPPGGAPRPAEGLAGRPAAPGRGAHPAPAAPLAAGPCLQPRSSSRAARRCRWPASSPSRRSGAGAAPCWCATRPRGASGCSACGASSHTTRPAPAGGLRGGVGRRWPGQPAWWRRVVAPACRGRQQQPGCWQLPSAWPSDARAPPAWRCASCWVRAAQHARRPFLPLAPSPLPRCAAAGAPPPTRAPRPGPPRYDDQEPGSEQEWQLAAQYEAGLYGALRQLAGVQQRLAAAGGGQVRWPQSPACVRACVRACWEGGFRV